MTARAVHHEPVTPAVAYRVDTPDGAVVISGDTIVCDEIAELAAGADVLVHEAFRRDALRPFFDARPHLAHIASYHADTVDSGPRQSASAFLAWCSRTSSRHRHRASSPSRTSPTTCVEAGTRAR